MLAEVNSRNATDIKKAQTRFGSIENYADTAAHLLTIKSCFIGEDSGNELLALENHKKIRGAIPGVNLSLSSEELARFVKLKPTHQNVAWRHIRST